MKQILLFTLMLISFRVMGQTSDVKPPDNQLYAKPLSTYIWVNPLTGDTTFFGYQGSRAKNRTQSTIASVAATKSK